MVQVVQGIRICEEIGLPRRDFLCLQLFRDDVDRHPQAPEICQVLLFSVANIPTIPELTCESIGGTFLKISTLFHCFNQA